MIWNLFGTVFELSRNLRNLSGTVLELLQYLFGTVSELFSDLIRNLFGTISVTCSFSRTGSVLVHIVFRASSATLRNCVGTFSKLFYMFSGAVSDVFQLSQNSFGTFSDCFQMCSVCF